MSPTSYQAAPPRVSAGNLPPARSKSRRAATSIGQRIEQVENLARSHHPPLLARDSLLSARIGLDGLPILSQRIDLALERVDRRRQASLLEALLHEVTRPVLPALDGEIHRPSGE